ncbi:MAG: hypothetical protein ACOC55_01910 [Candidatus Natronoplasma sp.]
MKIHEVLEKIKEIEGIEAVNLMNSWTGEDGFVDVSITAEDGIQRSEVGE